MIICSLGNEVTNLPYRLKEERRFFLKDVIEF